MGVDCHGFSSEIFNCVPGPYAGLKKLCAVFAEARQKGTENTCVGIGTRRQTYTIWHAGLWGAVPHIDLALSKSDDAKWYRRPYSKQVDSWH